MAFVGQAATLVSFEAADDLLKKADQMAGTIAAKQGSSGVSPWSEGTSVAVGTGTGGGLGGAPAGGSLSQTQLTDLAKVNMLLQTGTTMAGMGASAQQQVGKALGSASGS